MSISFLYSSHPNCVGTGCAISSANHFIWFYGPFSILVSSCSFLWWAKHDERMRMARSHSHTAHAMPQNFRMSSRPVCEILSRCRYAPTPRRAWNCRSWWLDRYSTRFFLTNLRFETIARTLERTSNLLAGPSIYRFRSLFSYLCLGLACAGHPIRSCT